MAKSILRYFSTSSDFNEIGGFLADTLEAGVFTNATKHKVVLEAPGGSFVFKGHFDLVGGVATDGTVTGFTAFVNGERLMKGSNYDIDFGDLSASIGEEDTFALILSADRTFGSKKSDVIFSISKVIKGGDGDDLMVSGLTDKTMKGEDGNDTIIAGDGQDVLVGGKWKDVFVYLSPEDGIDDIRDFKVKQDKIGFDDGQFSVLGTSVDATEFVVGTDATTADQHVIYDSVTGNLYWDEDGVGGTGKIQLAHLDKGPQLTTANFSVDDFFS